MVNKKIFNAILCCYLVIGSSCLFAKPLYIEITGGQNFGVPLAVLPFVQHDTTSIGGFEDIAKIISNDLQSSGQFRTAPRTQMNSLPEGDILMQNSYWRRLGIENVISGEVKQNQEGLYDITFQVMGIYKQLQEEPLLKMQFANRSADEFRSLGHHISDLIFENLTGVKGFFSTRIAYITVDRYKSRTVHTLVVADADGRNDKALIKADYPIMTPSWSPDGKNIAYVSFRNNRASVKVVNVINGELEDLSNFAGINGAPAWSPDGKKLALVLSKDGAPKIYILDIKSKKLKRITSGGAIDTEPCWDPDGKSIVFTSGRGGKPQIYRVTVATEKVDRLTFEGLYNASPSLTPDGKNLIMMHQDKSENKGKNFSIAVQSLATGKVKKITKAEQHESPALAPNGMMVLYGSKEADRYILGAVSLDGRFKMRLPAQNGNVKEPAWSPFLS